MTMGLYVVRRLAGTFAMIAAVFFGMLSLFEVFEVVRRFGDEADLATLLILSLLRVPSTFYQIMPLLMILSSMALFLSLARSSELVVMRSAGRSAKRILVEPILAVVLFGCVIVALLNPLATASTRLYQQRLEALQNPEMVAQISLSDSALWLRQGDSLGQTVIRAESVGPDGLTFSPITFLVFDRDTNAPLMRIEAERGTLEPGRWRLSTAKQWTLSDPNPEVTAQRYDEVALETDLTPDRIRDSLAESGTISVWAMPEFIRAMERAGLSTRDHRAQFQAELALPLLMAAMMLIGAVLCLQHTRAGSASRRVLITVLAGFALFFLRNFAQVLGENGQIPVALAIWTPPVASMLLALGVLLHLEDG
ncbi:MAG: ABC-type lipopolysaccharide export system permease component LptG [Rhodobacteraceae bacterium HLUCCA12]|nr:MAG: ABC-type lipopolysaccharide export system permease component LptG [Rhodobacteraceae bacterium HLUCCA12]